MIDGGFEVFDSLAGGGGDTESFVGLNTEAEELGLGERIAEIGLVQEKQNWLFRFKGGFCDVFVFIIGVFRAVEGEEDEVGAVDGIGDLVLDTGFKIVIRVFQSGGVNQKKTVVDASHNIIAGRSLFAGDDSDVFVGKVVQETGLAGIGLADEGDDW